MLHLQSIAPERLVRVLCGLLCFTVTGSSPAQAPEPPAIRGPQQTPTLQPEQAPKTAPETQQVLPSYEGQKVTSVELAGRPGIDPKQYAGMLTQHPGETFSRQRIEESLAALEGTGQFQGVQLLVIPEAEGLRVLFILQPAIYYGIYHFPGAEHFSYARLLQVANYPPTGPYSPVEVQQAQTALKQFFQRTGYFEAEVRPELQTDAAHGLVNVTFHVTLGRRAEFGNVTIEGPTPAESEHLEGVLHSFMARLRASAIRPGKKYHLKTVTNATQYLSTALTKDKHLAAKVRLIGANYHPETNRADVAFHVDSGPLSRSR